MAENNQSAIVQELYRRRESLDPGKRAVVDELAKRFNIAAGPKADEPFADYKPMSGGDMVTAAAKQLGSAIISPITSIPSAAREVWDWAKGGFEAPAVTKQRAVLAGTSNTGPGEIGNNPLEQAEGNALTAAMIAGGPAAVHLAKAGAGKVADFATSPSIVQGLKRSSEGVIIGSAMHGNVPGMVTGGAARVVAGKLGDIGKRRAAAAEAAKPATPAAPIPEAIPQLYEDLARSQAGKSFSRLDPSEQAAVKQMAERIQNGVQPEAPPVVAPETIPPPAPQRSSGNQLEAEIQSTPTPKIAEPIPISPRPPTKATIKPKAAEIAQQLHDEMTASGTAPAANGALPIETPIGSPVYAAEARHLKSDTVAKALHENGISFDDAKKVMTIADWKTVFEGLGEHGPGAFSGDPAATVGQTLLKLKALEKAAGKKTPVMPISAPAPESAGLKVGDSVSWTINGKTKTGTLEALGGSESFLPEDFYTVRTGPAAKAVSHVRSAGLTKAEPSAATAPAKGRVVSPAKAPIPEKEPVPGNLSQGEYPRVKEAVSGLKIRDEVPNRSSIESSLTNYEELPGIREIPMSALEDPTGGYYSASDHARVNKLARDISESGEINPLIAVIDDKGVYILEGGHRMASLHKIGKQSFPAKVVIDRDAVPVSAKPTAAEASQALVAAMKESGSLPVTKPKVRRSSK